MKCNNKMQNLSGHQQQLTQKHLLLHRTSCVKAAHYFSRCVTHQSQPEVILQSPSTSWSAWSQKTRDEGNKHPLQHKRVSTSNTFRGTRPQQKNIQCSTCFTLLNNAISQEQELFSRNICVKSNTLLLPTNPGLKSTVTWTELAARTQQMLKWSNFIRWVESKSRTSRETGLFQRSGANGRHKSKNSHSLKPLPLCFSWKTLTELSTGVWFPSKHCRTSRSCANLTILTPFSCQQIQTVRVDSFDS